MSYTVRTYDHNSDQTSEAERFRDETVVRKNIVKFTGYGSSGDVLNLITASLRKGLQYLKAEHKRGKEPDELITARIEVGEQIEMLF